MTWSDLLEPFWKLLTTPEGWMVLIIMYPIVRLYEAVIRFLEK